MKIPTSFAIGAKVILTMNLWADAGLYNGAPGKVVDIVWHSNNDKMPSVIYVEFPNFTGAPFFHNQPRVVPIYPETLEFDNHKGEYRTQFPLLLGWALTTGKAQGRTLNKVMFSIGNIARRGNAYVGCSRHRTDDDFMFVDKLDVGVFERLKASHDMKRREDENNYLEILCKETLEKYKKLIIEQIEIKNINIEKFSESDQSWINDARKNYKNLQDFTKYKRKYKRTK